MSEVVRCPTCGGVARMRRRSQGPDQLIAITDEEKTRKIEQLKRAIAKLKGEPQRAQYKE